MWPAVVVGGLVRETNKVTATIPVSGTGARGVAVDPSTDMIYAASPGMVVINGTTDTVVATISGVGGFTAANPATGRFTPTEPRPAS
jgi:DNA-binding beta-propeller fold protein YncE